MRKPAILFAFAAVLVCASQAAPAANSDTAVTIRIGQAVVALTGPWKFHIGDDPRWADPNFDDSAWENVDLTPKGARDYFGGNSEFVPGWTAMGHPGYAGYAWYRLKVRIEQTSAPLSLLMPTYVDDGYQVYANRREIGHFGDLAAEKPMLYESTIAEWFPLLAAAVGEGTTLAVRFYMHPATLLVADAGGMHGAPRIGEARIIAALGSLARQQSMMLNASYFLEFIIYIGFAGALLALYWLDRTEKVYLWFACAYLTVALGELLGFASTVQAMPMEADNAVGVAVASSDLFLITGWWHWFELKEKRWLIRSVWVAFLIRMLAEVCTDPPLLGTAVPLGWLPAWRTALNLSLLAIGLLFAVLVVYGIRRLGRQGWLTLPAALLFAVSLFRFELAVLHIPAAWKMFGIRISLGQMAEIALSSVLGILILRRFQKSQRRKQQLEADLHQAQQVQQVLLPQAIPEMPGFRIECEYRPAQEVGGDFFQVLEVPNGGVLVIIGDVSGKGVRAAMLVALIVGTLRTIAEETEEPQEILQRLNRRLVGRMENGLATCLCARIAPDGSLMVANAGHLAPWLDGQEIEVPHDLPLGLADGIEYAATHLQIPENSTLTFVSDGVVEAKDSHKELFGFERVRTLSTRAAAEIAGAAAGFGQQDDITVLTIQRVPVPTYA